MNDLLSFYTKNVFHVLLFMCIGFFIAFLDVQIRKLIRESVMGREGFMGEVMEGMETGGSSDCPQDCAAVDSMQKKMTSLIAEGTKLREKLQKNDEMIREQGKMIESLEKNMKNLKK